MSASRCVILALVLLAAAAPIATANDWTDWVFGQL